MPVYPRGDSFQVQVTSRKALPGYGRIRKTAKTREEADNLEAIIAAALDLYGKWPVEAGDKPLADTKERTKGGTLREAARIAKETHWAGTPYGKTAEGTIDCVVRWMEAQGVYDLDAITSDHLDLFVKHCRAEGNKASTINAKLSALSVVGDLALTRRPALAHRPVPVRRVPADGVEKWWLTPEDQERAIAFCRAQGDEVMADYINFTVYTGLRVDEVLALEPKHFTGLDGSEPFLLVPGTKTKGSQASIALSSDAVPIAKRRIEACREHKWKNLWPIAYTLLRARWQEVRAHLGASGDPSATLKNLRRSFAAYATRRGMPSLVLKRAMRHSSISTTDGYLQLVGGEELKDGRQYLHTKKQGDSSEVAEAIQAYAATGASGEEVAKFVKELMRK